MVRCPSCSEPLSAPPEGAAGLPTECPHCRRPVPPPDPLRRPTLPAVPAFARPSRKTLLLAASVVLATAAALTWVGVERAVSNAEQREQEDRARDGEAAYREGLAALERRDYAEAVTALTEATRRAPKSAVAHAHLGDAYAGRGDWEEAVKHYTRALGLNPRLAPARCNRANALCELGRYAEAVHDCTEALRFNPDQALAHAHRSRARYHLGEYAAAVVDAEQALELDPANGPALHTFAWLLATCPDGKVRDGRRALDLARRLAALGRTPWHQGPLAAALAETGYLAEAARVQREVVAGLAEKGGDPGAAGAARQRLAVFEQGQPYHGR
jgi:tetratricopeptide (TPR) repeat protein